MLVDGGAAAETVFGIVIVEVAFGGDLHGLPVEAVVLVEAGVFGGDDGVLEVGGDAVEGNEVVDGGVGLGGEPGLDAALGVDRGGGRVDEAENDEGEGGEQPERRENDEEPSGEGAERELSARRRNRVRAKARAGQDGDASGYRGVLGHKTLVLGRACRGVVRWASGDALSSLVVLLTFCLGKYGLWDRRIDFGGFAVYGW